MTRLSLNRWITPRPATVNGDDRVWKFVSGFELRQDSRAITSWEYALIAALIAIAIVGSVTTMGTTTMRPFTTIAADINAASK